MPRTDIERLAEALVAVIDAENRYKDGGSDDTWTNQEMAQRKNEARSNGIKLLKDLRLYPKDRRI